MVDNLRKNLQAYFGYTAFRPLQEAIIRDVLAQKDVFVLMPTGSGKSLCYQLPATLLNGITVVVSPLISLMKDQVDGLTSNGVRAAFLNSSLTTAEQQHVAQQLKKGALRLVYVAPERLMQPSFLDFLKNVPVRLFAIDEAHCISEWGHDFRPHYRALSQLRNYFPRVPIIALTATATKRVKQDIVDQLHLSDAKHYDASFNRPNLSYTVIEKREPYEQLVAFIKGQADQSGIIYCQTRERVERLVTYLAGFDIVALPYHAGLPDHQRKDNQEKFIRDDVQIVVATIAFGMGIDKPNVRFVVHFDLPANLERYYQETGRAGRDCLPSECVLFYSYTDRNTIEHFIRQKDDPKEQQIALKQLNQVTDYAESARCRRVNLLNYFGEALATDTCKNCDNCTKPVERVEATELTQKVLSGILRLRQRFGMAYVCKVLHGNKIARIKTLRHDRLSTYGILKHYSEKQIGTIIRELIQLGLVTQTDDEYATLKLTPKGILTLKNKETVYLRKVDQPTIAYAARQATDYDQTLFEQLRRIRKEIADDENVPPYIIFSDASLQEMARVFPQTREEFAKIKGVGSKKLASYAQEFLPPIKHYYATRVYRR